MHRLFAVIVMLLASPWAFAGVQIQHWTSAKGARVYFVETRALPILDVQVDFAAGTMFDSPDKAGLAALTRSLLDLGAGKLDENALADRLADLGASLGGDTDSDRAKLSLRTLSDPDKRGPALELLQLVLHAPRFDPAVFQREKVRAASSLKDALTRPETIASRAFWEALYPGHPYGRKATPEGILALKRDDVLAFHRRFYVAANAVVTLVGDISRGQAEAIADSLVAGLPAGAAATLPAAPALPAAADRKLPHPASQSHLLLGLPTVERGNPDYFPLLVGNYSLGGGGFVSRLMTEVRDKRGYAYSVYSQVTPLRQAGPFQIALQTKRGQAQEALQLTRKILTDFLTTGPTTEELAAAKANLTGSFPLRLDSNRKLLDNVSAIAFYRLPLDYLDTYRQKIEAVTLEEVRRAFARHVRPEHIVGILVATD